MPEHPGLVQWLALADEKQDDVLVAACLDKLIPLHAAESLAREALSSYSLRPIMDGLRPETKSELLCRMAGVPSGWKVRGR